ncbi:hypothetical protein V8D89_010065 [Ganoderma adspersum]
MFSFPAHSVLLRYIFLGLVLLSWPTRDDPPRQSTGYTDVVQWDNYTLFLHNQRLFLHAGEFHTFRLPVPELWLDIFQKMVAAGLNGASTLGVTNPSPGVLDFNDWRAFQPIFDAAKLAGIFVMNGEATSGGLSHWITSQIAGTVRTNDTDWTAAYRLYISGVINQTVHNQVTEGGPLLAIQIDNENRNSQDPRTQEYFQQLEDQYHEGGIVIPLTYNDPGMRSGFVNGTGHVNIYGLDAYPQGFNCSTPLAWSGVTNNYHQYHEANNPSEPWFMPEFQGGAFDPWGGPGYDACAVLTGADFQDVFYKHNWAANVKLVSYYMFYGGTNWGGLPFPGVYTSYDYGSSIRENRALTDKFDEVKRQGLFIRSSPQFLKTDWVGNSSVGIPGVALNGSAGFVTSLRNPDSGTWFHVTRQADSTSTANISFSLTVPTSQGTLTLPQTTGAIALDGRQSKLVITDYAFGAHGVLLYTTASIFFAGTIGTRDSHEFAFAQAGTGTRAASPRIKFPQASSASGHYATVAVLPQSGSESDAESAGLLTIWDSDEQLVLFADPATTATFWAPAVRHPTSNGNTVAGLENFWQFGTNATVLVGGPHLVRNATLSRDSTTLALRGDLNASVALTVVAPPSVRAVSWNGKAVDVRGDGRGVLRGRLERSGDVERVRERVPKLEGWRFKDSLPEVRPGFDDAGWAVADHTTTNIFLKPVFGDGRVLYGAFKLCEHTVLWRGHFNATGSETSANLTVYGGTFFASSVWINDKFISTVTSSADHVNALFPFPEGVVVPGQDNVVTVIQENMGNDEQANIKPARGIAGFELNGNGTFTTWKVQGKLGGYTDFPDKVRGVLNEGGLFGERQGWHLPGFDTSHESGWTVRDLSEGLPGRKAGVGFFVTTFELDFPSDADVLMGFQFEAANTQPYRALLFVNGWMFGKRVANLGPQTKFPVPPGILNYNGKNTVAVSLWALNNTAVSPTLELVVDEVLDGGVGPISTNNPKWEPR